MDVTVCKIDKDMSTVMDSLPYTHDLKCFTYGNVQCYLYVVIAYN